MPARISPAIRLVDLDIDSEIFVRKTNGNKCRRIFKTPGRRYLLAVRRMTCHKSSEQDHKVENAASLLTTQGKLQWLKPIYTLHGPLTKKSPTPSQRMEESADIPFTS